ncbi:class I SAM-dependent methyltransferase [Parvularcula sp. ZS-1/3]|uniref:Class I SAM-dependent methyltransferase n=1 Tax=Parvularcula mediterranea TaxID=2732508 RepID=A0A7Y3RMU9_9PROT|nr:class I SAM-dependent methyltransferase [Parvularcula mediterranea]NNU16900.1 class I SAM-dependent methyltransferase [Parvularcula mediterranea]
MDQRLRERLIALARSLRVLPFVEKMYTARQVEEAAAANKEWQERNPDKVFPPADLICRTYGDATFRGFDSWGRANATDITAIIERHIKGERLDVAEWGCGLGRIAVHLPERWDYIGFDIDQSSIDWCKEHLRGTYKLNDPEPPLPTDDESFDVVFAVSIFTHLSDEAHRVWPREIARILRPGGIFVFTVHGDEQATKLTGSERRSFDEGELVVRGGVEEGSRTYLAYQPKRFVDEVLLEPFVKLEGPFQALGHTVYVARKS